MKIYFSTHFYKKSQKNVLNVRSKIYSKKTFLRGLNENDVENCVFNENNKFMRIDQRLNYLVSMLKYGNNYAVNTLDQIYNFLIKTFTLFLNHSSSVKDIVNKLSNLVRVMSIYSHFDYALNENYLKNFEDLKI